MNTSESADELVKICIDGMDRFLRISGVAAKNIAVMLIAMSKENTQTKGKTRLNSMLKSGKPLDIFTIKAEDLKKFSQEAKRYGILYCALANKRNNKIDGMVDIMVREEDGAKLERISERFNFKSLAKIKEEYEKSKQERATANKLKSEDEQFIDDIMPKEKEEQKDFPSNNTKETEEKSQSEISSNIKSKDKVESSKENKNSVIKDLKEIEKELKAKEEQNTNTETPELQANNSKVKDKQKEKGGKRYKEKNQKNKGKRYKEPKHLDNTPKSKKPKNKSKGRSK